MHRRCCRFCISIHSLHTEGDHEKPLEVSCQKYFNPLPPHGGRRGLERGEELVQGISIHSLHTEGDADHPGRVRHRQRFQSTPSTRRETRRCVFFGTTNEISIHSLHTEGDVEFSGAFCSLFCNFNPLPPHGGRRIRAVPLFFHGNISIHSLHTEGDSMHFVRFRNIAHFNPLPPHGGRLCFTPSSPAVSHFNPLPPHGGRPPTDALERLFTEFQSTPSTRRETERHCSAEAACHISIHSLHTEGDK